MLEGPDCAEQRTGGNRKLKWSRSSIGASAVAHASWQATIDELAKAPAARLFPFVRVQPSPDALQHGLIKAAAMPQGCIAIIQAMHHFSVIVIIIGGKLSVGNDNSVRRAVLEINSMSVQALLAEVVAGPAGAEASTPSGGEAASKPALESAPSDAAPEAARKPVRTPSRTARWQNHCQAAC